MSAKKTPEVIDGIPYWRCAKCDTLKLAEEYHPRSDTGNGLYAYCKICQRKIARDFYKRTKKVLKSPRKSAKV